MLRSGDELVSVANGMRLLVRHSAQETGGRFVEWEATYPPHSPEPPVHNHPNQEERFEVLSGSVQVRLNGSVRALRAGEVLLVPAGTRHSMWNAAAEEARTLWRTEPALRTEQFHETLCALAEQGKITSRGIPNVLQAVVLAAEYQNEIEFAKPHRLVQRVLFAVLAPLGRRLGYRGVLPVPRVSR